MSAPPPAQALFLGPPGESVFAWLHQPAAGSTASFGLVICNPFGFEEVCAHRSLRCVAEAAAAWGVPTLRFDYAGCGNSEGDESDPDRIAAWLRSVHQAADALKQASGVKQVCLLGVRLGATLATLVALEREDVTGLVAVAPVVRGRAYLRELTMLGETGLPTGARASPAEGGAMESAGFVISAQTVAALNDIDLRTLSRSPAPRILLIDRDDVPSAAPWAASLESLGGVVQRVEWPGYAAMMRDPQRSQVPQAIIDGLTQTLLSWQVKADALDIVHRPIGHAVQLTGTLQESAVGIEVGGHQLFGVLTRQVQAGPQPAVLMLNSGSVHHIGPNRLWVQLSRRWAAQGVTVLRLDISGIGESPARPGAQDNVVYSPYAGADIACAIEYLQREVGATSCHVMGLCSGGYHALKAAMAGLPMSSMLMINPLTFHWKEGMALDELKDYEVIGLTSKFRGKLLAGESWKKLLRGQVDIGLVLEVAAKRLWAYASVAGAELARWLHIPMRNDLARELGDVAKRGVQLKFVFAEGAPGYALLQHEGGRSVRSLVRRGRATLDFISGADHTFTRLEARERLVSLLDQRVLAECKLQ